MTLRLLALGVLLVLLVGEFGRTGPLVRLPTGDESPNSSNPKGRQRALSDLDVRSSLEAVLTANSTRSRSSGRLVGADPLERLAPRRVESWPPLWAHRVREEVLEANQNTSLIMIIEVCRHGARVPLGTYPRDPLPYHKWPEGIGQLTPIGIHQQFELGRILRYVYDGFLPVRYNVVDVHVRSSDIDRALVSATNQLLGLFYTNTSDTRVQYQPVPVHTIETCQDIMMLPGVRCARWQELKMQTRLSGAWRELEAANQLWLEYLGRNIMGLGRPATLDDVATAYDVWECDAAQGIELPPEVNHSVRERVRTLYGFCFADLYRSAEAANLTGGPLALHILNLLRTKIAGLRTEKFVLFSGHDTTLAALLAVLGMHPERAPPFGSTIIVELRELHQQPPNGILKAGSAAISTSDIRTAPNAQRQREQQLPQMLQRSDDFMPWEALDKWYIVVRYNWEVFELPGCEPICTLRRFMELVSKRSSSARSSEIRAEACRPSKNDWLTVTNTPDYIARDTARRKWGVVFILGVLSGVLVFLGCVAIFWLGWRLGTRQKPESLYNPVTVEPLGWESSRTRSSSEATPATLSPVGAYEIT